MKKVIVVGGGPAGMCASVGAAQSGAEVLLLERNEKLGKKLYITGKGRCNLTNNADIGDFFANIPRNPRFLYSALYGFTNTDLVALVEEGGTPTKAERGGRVFPVSDRASDVTAALEKQMRQAGVKVRLHTMVKQVLTEEGHVTGVVTEQGKLPCDAVIFACGGISYPSTGSDGNWVGEIQRLGHTVEPMTGRLVGVDTNESWCASLSGLTLKNVTLTAFERGKKVYTEQGEMLFTHHGISGPLVLSASCNLTEAAQATFLLDLKPALDAETLDKRLVRELTVAGTKQLRNVMPALVPAALGDVVLEVAGLATNMTANAVTREMRRRLGDILKNLPLTGKAFRPVAEAIITRGGVKVKEIDPSTMESKLVKGLYFAGEMIDVDAYTGGFNITVAASTGMLAGRSSAYTEGE